MSEPTSAVRARSPRLLLIRALIVVGVLFAIAMGVGMALSAPPPEASDPGFSR